MMGERGHRGGDVEKFGRGWGREVGRDLAMGSVVHRIKFHVGMVRNALVLGEGKSSNTIYVHNS